MNPKELATIVQGAQPNFVHEVTINSRRLTKGMEATLTRGVGYPAGRYRFEYGENLKSGELMLQFYGPIRRTRQRYRLVAPSVVKTVHTKTSRREEEQEEA